MFGFLRYCALLNSIFVPYQTPNMWTEIVTMWFLEYAVPIWFELNKQTYKVLWGGLGETLREFRVFGTSSNHCQGFVNMFLMEIHQPAHCSSAQFKLHREGRGHFRTPFTLAPELCRTGRLLTCCSHWRRWMWCGCVQRVVLPEPNNASKETPVQNPF